MMAMMMAMVAAETAVSKGHLLARAPITSENFEGLCRFDNSLFFT